MVKLLSYDETTGNHVFIADNFDGEDKNKLAALPGENGKDNLANYKFLFGDMCIDITTGGSHWLGSEGWV